MNAQGELVTLRAMDVRDGDALWRWNHDADVMRWMDAGYPQSRLEVEKRLAERPSNDYGDVLFGIETRDDATLIGLVRLSGAEPETGIAELDIYLAKTHWGKGFGTDAMRTACRYGFDRMRLRKITLTVVAANDAAIRLYRKVGFVEEGRLRAVFHHEGEWIDKLMMGLLAGELR